ncbi:MAG: Gfo/Idh/MocA family oxidoreductase [Fluviicola sp.]|nr:Gfo/Idh/MocA family oxidoreductase [Fluviicola sp.]
MKILLLGCGNMGAFYDFDNDQVLTYAKAFSLHTDWQISLFDTNSQHLSMVGRRYGFEQLSALEDVNFSRFDVVCIATSTPTHFTFLSKALTAKVPVIVCEKPISTKANELAELEVAYKNGSSKVMVNYIRRFQPAYGELKKRLHEYISEESIQSIRFNYKKGLLNNASHGLDILQFLLATRFQFQNSNILEMVYDVFNDDPTTSCIIPQDGYLLELIGHPNTTNAIFDITVTFQTKRLLILDGGNTIRIEENNGTGSVVYSANNAIHNYMIPVIEHLEKLINTPTMTDNFQESLELNRHLLLLLNEHHT